MATRTGVYPVFDLEFMVSLEGKVEHTKEGLAKMKPVKEMETFENSIDGNVVEWSPMETKGWVRRLMTGKGFSFSLSGKRHEGDEGNDFIAKLGHKTGVDCSTTAGVKFPNGDVFLFDSVVDVKSNFGGASTDVSALNFDLLSDGKPTYLTAAEAGTQA